MNNFFIVIIASILFFSSSCETDGPSYDASYKVINNSEHKIDLKMFNQGLISDSLRLLYSEFKEYLCSSRAGVSDPPPFLADSLKVFFDDTISITHYRIEEQIALRSLLLKKSWSGGQVSEYDYNYKYIFTETDYNEVLDNQ
ncbi:MAG: hypothetical protein U9R32_09765 [Bacteroidota bacterium]|nr:hypothetical protein [Bacteroidota bacterium]